MKTLSALLFVTIVLVAGSHVYAGATVTGHVALPDKPSVDVINKRYQMNGEQVVVAPDPPAAVVYLEGTFPPSHKKMDAQMAQKNIDFVPRLLPVQLGTTVEFPNQDPMYHSLFSFSEAKRFDLGRYRSDETPVPSVVFDKPGVIVLHCDIHENMRAIILVLETPYFVKTDPKGNYTFPGLPSGTYQLKAWLNNKTTLSKQVVLKDGETLHVDFP